VNKRYSTIAAYQRQTGLSYQTIKNALDSGELPGIRTKGGFWKVDTQAGSNPDLGTVLERLDTQGRLLQVLASHLGVNGG